MQGPALLSPSQRPARKAERPATVSQQTSIPAQSGQHGPLQSSLVASAKNVRASAEMRQLHEQILKQAKADQQGEAKPASSLQLNGKSVSGSKLGSPARLGSSRQLPYAQQLSPSAGEHDGARTYRQQSQLSPEYGTARSYACNPQQWASQAQAAQEKEFRLVQGLCDEVCRTHGIETGKRLRYSLFQVFE